MGHLRRGECGLTLVDLMVSFSVLVIALMAFSQSLVQSSRAASSQRQRDVAIEAARQALEGLQAEDFSTLYARYSAGGAPGPNFAVPGVEVDPADLDGLAGEILFPTAVANGGLQLREDLQDARFGTPKDLSGDGVIDALDHTADHQILPVLVRVQWLGSSGPASVEFRTILKGL